MLMTLENTVLEKLSEWRPGAGRQELHVAADGWGMTVTADRSDALGCLLWELDLQRDGTKETDVQAWAANAARRITGLMEPLKLIEIDTVRKEAQLRSETPLERGEKRLYYELLLRGFGAAILRRYQAINGNGKREQMPFVVTHEALAKLAGDVAASA
jgi:hypothetical protein